MKRGKKNAIFHHKNIRPVFLAAMIILGAAGCKTSNGPDADKQASQTEAVSEPAEDKASENTAASQKNGLSSLFDDVFITYREEINILTLDEALTHVENGYDAEVKEPLDSGSGINGITSVTVTDGSGMYVTMHFFPNEDGAVTLSLLAYGDENRQISVSDNIHSSGVKYGTYYSGRDPANAEVQSPDEQLAFILSEQ